jgi:hypothetical protein
MGVVFDGCVVCACVDHMSCNHHVHIINVMMIRVGGYGCGIGAPVGSMCEAGVHPRWVRDVYLV